MIEFYEADFKKQGVCTSYKNRHLSRGRVYRKGVEYSYFPDCRNYVLVTNRNEDDPYMFQFVTYKMFEEQFKILVPCPKIEK